MNVDRGVDPDRFRGGDHSTFRAVVEAYSPRLLPVVRAFAADDDEAHDLLQEVWRRAWEKRRTFAGIGTLLGWLWSIARTVGLAAARKRRRARSFDRDRVQVAEDGAADPSEHAERDAMARAIRRALLTLPEREREVVILRLLEGRSTRETAAALDCAEGTVKAALHHALKKLRAPLRMWASL